MIGILLPTVRRCDTEATQMLSEVFGFHPLAVRACAERNHIPRVHAYSDHVFVVLDAPEPATTGHVHLLELDQFIGHRYLVTVHGPWGRAPTWTPPCATPG